MTKSTLSKITLIGLATLALGTSANAFEGNYECDTGGIELKFDKDGKSVNAFSSDGTLPGTYKRIYASWELIMPKKVGSTKMVTMHIHGDDKNIQISDEDNTKIITSCRKFDAETATIMATMPSGNTTKTAETAETAETTKPSGTYYIQVASYTNKPNQELIDQINMWDFEYELINNKVLLGPFDTEKVTRDILPRIKEGMASDAFFKKIK